MLARSPIEILGDTEFFLAERVGLLDGAVHPSESRASLRPARAIAGGANIAKISGGSRVNRRARQRLMPVCDERRVIL